MKNAVLEKKDLNDRLKMLQSSVWKDYASRDSKGQSLYDLASYDVFGEPYIKLSNKEKRKIQMALKNSGLTMHQASPKSGADED